MALITGPGNLGFDDGSHTVLDLGQHPRTQPVITKCTSSVCALVS